MNSSSRNFNAFKLASVFAAIMPKTMEELKTLHAAQQELNIANTQEANNSFFRPRFKHPRGGKSSPRMTNWSWFPNRKDNREVRRAQRVRMNVYDRRVAALRSMISKGCIGQTNERNDLIKIENLKIPLTLYVECGGTFALPPTKPVDRFAAFKNL